MKIGIDVRAAQLGHGVRGIGKYIYDLVDGVTRFSPQNEYVIIALPDTPLPQKLQGLPACCRVAGLPTPLMDDLYPTKRRARYVWRFYYLQMQARHGRSLARLAAREGLDVLHQTNVADITYFPGSRPSCRLVQTFYDAIPAARPEEFLNRWPVHRRYIYQLQLAACKRADAVVAISHSARCDAIQYASLSPSRVQVVYPAVPENFRPVTDQPRLVECQGRLGIRTPYFLFCSGLDATKNVQRVLKAFRSFAEPWRERFSLVMVTQGSSDLDRWVAEAGMSRERIFITGFVSDEDLVTLYAGATALLSPSLHEGFGLPAAQAMGVGTPVIASNRSAQPEVVGDAGLLVDPEDVEAIAQAMRRLAGDASLRAELSLRGQERVRQFGWERQAASMLEIYAGKSTAVDPCYCPPVSSLSP